MYDDAEGKDRHDFDKEAKRAYIENHTRKNVDDDGKETTVDDGVWRTTSLNKTLLPHLFPGELWVNNFGQGIIVSDDTLANKLDNLLSFNYDYWWKERRTAMINKLERVTLYAQKSNYTDAFDRGL